MGAFHEGERALQLRAGVDPRRSEAAARAIRDHMPDQHREFFALLPFLLVGSVDAQGQPWASVLTGAPGFAASPDPRHLDVRARPRPDEPLSRHLRPGAALGLLGIQPHTRRRNRMNGRVEHVDERGFRVRVDQSFGNCPKYIQAREARHIPGAPAAAPIESMDVLDAHSQDLVRRADTFFIATAHPRLQDSASPGHGADVSHRGGRPGFVRVDAGRVLTFPDFTGNSFFNTLGNLLLEPRCGLLFIDFERGDTLQVSARAQIVGAGAELEAYRGALRLVKLEVLAARRAAAALPLRWGPAEPSPVLEATGTW